MTPSQTVNCKDLLLIDDHPIVSVGLKALLEDSQDFALTHMAQSSREAIAMASQKPFDIIILDLVLPGRSGLEVIPELRDCCPDCRIVVYSSLPENLYAARSIKAGAHAYVHKEAGLSQLQEALYTVSAGKIHVSEEVKEDMLLHYSDKKSGENDLSVLSNQELNVLRLIGSGLRLSEIAAELGISPKTVGTHRERIKNKLNLHSGRELDLFAVSVFSSLPDHTPQV